MKAKDTVMSDEDLSEVVQRQTGKWGIVSKDFIMDIARVIANAQAPISFREGVREAAKWAPYYPKLIIRYLDIKREV